MAALSARILAWLNSRYTPKERPRYFDVNAYQTWLEKNGRDLYEHFYSKHSSFASKNVLDIGCGYGGKLSAYSKENPSFTCGVDIQMDVLRGARGYLRDATRTVVACADAAALPFADSSFDVVLSDDGFDHFKEPHRVISEMTRVLKPGGLALVSFVPYYSRDCSHMSEYLLVPWHHVFFSRTALRQALDLIAARSEKHLESETARRTPVEGVFNVFENYLSRLTFAGLKRALRANRGITLVRMRRQSQDWARPLSYLWGVNELFVDCVYFVLRKDETNARIRSTDFLRQTGLDLLQDARAIRRRFGSFARRAFFPARAAARPDGAKE